MRNFYSKDGIIVRDSIKSDAEYLADKLRESDVREVKASHQHTPAEALYASLDSFMCLTILVEDKPIAMFGITAAALLSRKATIWLLASDELTKIQRRFLRNGRAFVGMFQAFYPDLENWVDARNKESIKWLRWLGATIEESEPYGVEGLPFHHFCFRRV